MACITSIVEDERAATAIEYGLIAGLISIAIIGSLTYVAGEMSGMWTYVSTTLDAAIQ